MQARTTTRGKDTDAGVTTSGDRRRALLLIAGAAVGVILAALGLLRAPGRLASVLPAGAVARVNGELIWMEDYQRAVNGVAQDLRAGIDEEQRRRILDRLIDEELLLQRALDLGVARSDLKVRRTLTSSMIDSVVAAEDSSAPSDAELRDFYSRETDFFTSPGQLQVRQIWFRAGTPADAPGALARAQQALDRLRAGTDFATVKTELGDQELAPLPESLLPITKLSDYLGPTALRTVLALGGDSFSEPVRSNSGYHVLQVVERRAAAPPLFEDVKPQVLAELRRRNADQALRAYLDDLRQRSQVVISPSLP